jgi:hypothetical protein
VYLEHQFEGQTGHVIASTTDFLHFTKVSNNPTYLPNAGVFRENLFAVGGLEGPYVSVDHGKSWTLSTQGLADVLIYALMVDPDGYLYAGTYRGVQRSTKALVSTATDRPDGNLLFNLETPIPNPFRTHTALSLTIDCPQHVHLALYNGVGQCVRVLGDAFLPPGTHDVNLDAAGLCTGTYFLRAEEERVTRIQYLLLIR